MNFHWFHLMPYRFLPEDFSASYRSVWVDVPSKLFDPAKANQLYNEFLDELEFAEQVGFDGICCNEHHQNAYGLMPSPNLIAAALTRRTSRAALIVLGNSIALYNPPVRVAEEMAMLDCMSGGRLVAGFPVGTSMDTNFCYGQTPATLRDKYHEAHDLIIKAWTEPEMFSFNGKYTQLRYVNIWPRPVQQPHPPIWIPGGGSIETWEWTSQMEYVYCYLSYSGWMRGKQVMDGYWKTLEQMQADDNPYHAGFLQLVCVSESEEQAEKDYAEHVEYFYDKCLHVWSGWADAPGYRTVRTLQAGFGAQVGQSAVQQRQKLKWKDLVAGGYVVAGSPQQVVDKMANVIQELRVGQLMVLCQIGSMPPELVRKNTEMFAREVMPHLKGIWGNYEDRWTPKPLSERAAPAAVAAPVSVAAK